jgi:glyoxylate carboligase
MHFVQGSLIFTDGHKGAGYYETARVDEKSTQYTKVYTNIYIDPKIDEIQFPDKNGLNYLSVYESNVTNVMAARVLNGTEAATYPTIVTNGVIHEIDKVLLFNQVDTQ